MTALGAKQYQVGEDDDGPLFITLKPASAESVATVLAASEGDPEGRSEWLWVRLPDGGLVLGVYPQSDTYMATEHDHSTPIDVPVTEHCGGNHRASPGKGHAWMQDGHRLWCPGRAKVYCDQHCGAFYEPDRTNPAEVLAAMDHWSTHSADDGCAHEGP
jgi:hypothetical protein